MPQKGGQKKNLKRGVRFWAVRYSSMEWGGFLSDRPSWTGLILRARKPYLCEGKVHHAANHAGSGSSGLVVVAAGWARADFITDHASTGVEGSLVNPETGLLPQVEVPDRLGDCFELDLGDVVVATFFTTASCGQGPPHLQAMAVLIPLVTGNFHLGRKVTSVVILAMAPP